MTRVFEMGSSMHSMRFDNGDVIVGVICSLGGDGYTMPVIKDGESSRSATKKIKRFAKDALKRGDRIYLDSRYLS